MHMRFIVRVLTKPYPFAVVATLVAWYAHAFGASAYASLVAILAAVVAVVIGRVRLNTSASARQLQRWQRIDRRRLGTARASDVRRHAGVWSLRRRAAVLRPSLASVSWWERMRIDPKQLGTPLARLGHKTIWSSLEDATMRIAGPRSGKTGEMGCLLLDAPGAALVTSTRVDLHRLTAGLRGRVGHVGIFNPDGLGGLPTTVSFNPLVGCHDPAVAATRADDLVPQVGDDGERKYWRGQAVRVLSALLYAAGQDPTLDMRDVHRWVAAPQLARQEVGELLKHADARTVGTEVIAFFTMNDRTQSSITAGMMPALAWVHSDTAFAAASGKHMLDVGEFIRGRNTIYLLGRSEGLVAPLVTALTSHIARESRRIAESSPHGRLDPPLTMILDEVAIICQVPLPDWTADMGGRNVTIHMAAQSRAQLVNRWGESGARVILSNVATLMLMGGGNDPEELKIWEDLSGVRDVDRQVRDRYGRVESVTTGSSSVITAQHVRQLTVGQAALYRRGMPPMLADVDMVWDRPDVRAYERGLRLAERSATRAERAASRRPRRGTSRTKVAGVDD